jgi:serine-type D-Ala-D-Ala carboxypeptidase (penicillin-binding protein 5/6)
MRSILLSLFLPLLLLPPSLLQAQAPSISAPRPPGVAAKSWLLFDYNGEQTLAAHNPQQRVEPASLTKLMTAYVTFSALKQKTLKGDQAVTVPAQARRTEGSRMFIEVGTSVTVDDLLRGMIVQSGNDASIALAEAVAGSEEAFAQLMNREAQRLGLKNTHFANATGLPHPQQYSTAQDLVLIAAAIIRDFPEYYPLYSHKQFRYNNITQQNRNRLLWTDPTVDGVKTGHTEAAGYCLISSARRGERRLISVVFGAASEAARAAESQKLLNFGFQAYDGVPLYGKNHAVTTLRVWKGTVNEVKAGFTGGLYLALPRGTSDKLKASIESQQPLLAPIGTGQKVATLKLTLDGQPYGEFPVVALEEVPPSGIFGRGWDAIRLFFR